MQLDEDQAELRLLQEKFLEASDRHTDYKRTKQFRRAVLPIQMPGSVKVRKCYPSNAGQRMVSVVRVFTGLDSGDNLNN